MALFSALAAGPLTLVPDGALLGAAGSGSGFVPTMLAASDFGGVVQVIVFIIFIVIAIAGGLSQQNQQKAERKLQRRRNPDLNYGDGTDDDDRWERVDDEWLEEQGLPPRKKKKAAPERDRYDIVDAVEYDDEPDHESGDRARRARRARRAGRVERDVNRHAPLHQPEPVHHEIGTHKSRQRPAETPLEGRVLVSAPLESSKPRSAPDSSKSGEQGTSGKDQLLGPLTGHDLARGVILAEIVGKPKCFDADF